MGQGFGRTNFNGFFSHLILTKWYQLKDQRWTGGPLVFEKTMIHLSRGTVLLLMKMYEV